MKKIIISSIIAAALCASSFAAAYKDGKYTGSGNGRNGKIEVIVTVENQKITDVKITKCKESVKRPDVAKAIKELPAAIVEANGVEGVDAVTSATKASNGIFEAVNDALKNAGVAE